MIGRTWFAERVDLSWLVGVLVVGDLLAITGFVAAGQLQHGARNPFLEPTALAGAMAPFLIGWAITALVGGLYTHDAFLGPRRMVSWAVPAWIFGVLIALALRATSLFPGNVRGMFPLVAIFAGGLIVVGWRAIAAAGLSRYS